jgi:hypothetical protein
MASDEWVTRSIRIPGKLDAQLKKLAVTSYTSVQHEILAAVRAHLDRAATEGRQKA